MATLTLYNYSGPLDTINKTLTGGTVKTGTQVDTPQSFTDMQIIIESATAPTWNYCTMSDTGRNYFITNIEWLGGKAFMLTLHVDVLTSNKTAIDALYAQVEYSSLGDALEHDPRLDMKDYVTEYITDEVRYYNIYNDNTSGSDPMILLRYNYLPKRLGTGESPVNQLNTVRSVFMTPTSWGHFLAEYASANMDGGIFFGSDSKRTAVGNAIIDVSMVYYMTEARCAASSLTQATTLEFCTPDEPQGIVVNPVNWGATKFYICDNPAAQLATLGYYELPAATVPLAYYPYINATYVTHMPFIGDKQFVPAEWNIKQACSLKYRITFDMIGNNYIITPVKTINSTDTVLYEHVDVIENKNRVGFPINNSLNRTTWANAGLIAAGALSAYTGNFAGVVGAYKTLLATKEEVAGATHYKGGFSSDYDYAVELYPKFRNILRVVEYDTNPTVFWPKWGYPDHQVRQLSTLTDGDFFKCEKVEMRGFSTITKDEVDEIEMKLLSGVYA